MLKKKAMICEVVEFTTIITLDELNGKEKMCVNILFKVKK